MKIVFFGWVRMCDPVKIGGAESLTRRLTQTLADQGHNVAIIMYGAERYRELRENGNNITVRYYRSFHSALKCLSDLKYDFVFEMYINKRYYFQYLIFKWRMKAYMRFSIIFMTAAENKIKQWLRNKFRVMYCSPIFAVSPRVVKELRKKKIPAIWLPPPVPDYYFSIPRNREIKNKLVISFIGRIDPNKGLKKVMEVFKGLQKAPESKGLFVFKISGYFNHNQKSSIVIHNELRKLRNIEYSAQSHTSCKYSTAAEKQLRDFLSKTDILLLPYTNLKGTLDLPLLLLEGLAAGCVVISTDVGDMVEIIGSDALIAKSSEEMIEKIRNLSRSDIINNYSRKKVMSLFNRFSSTKVTEKLLNSL